MSTKQNLSSIAIRDEDSGGKRGRAKDDDSTYVENCVDHIDKHSCRIV